MSCGCSCVPQQMMLMGGVVEVAFMSFWHRKCLSVLPDHPGPLFCLLPHHFLLGFFERCMHQDVSLLLQVW